MYGVVLSFFLRRVLRQFGGFFGWELGPQLHSVRFFNFQRDQPLSFITFKALSKISYSLLHSKVIWDIRSCQADEIYLPPASFPAGSGWLSIKVRLRKNQPSYPSPSLHDDKTQEPLQKCSIRADDRLLLKSDSQTHCVSIYTHHSVLEEYLLIFFHSLGARTSRWRPLQPSGSKPHNKPLTRSFSSNTPLYAGPPAASPEKSFQKRVQDINSAHPEPYPRLDVSGHTVTCEEFHKRYEYVTIDETAEQESVVVHGRYKPTTKEIYNCT